MTRLLTLFLALILTANFDLSAQSIKPASMVQQVATFETVDLLSFEDDRNDGVPADFDDYSILAINQDNIENLLSSTAPAIKLAVPRANAKALTLSLVEVNIHPEGSYVISEPSGERVKVNPGKHYRGVIDGQEGSMAAISIFDGEIMGLATSSQVGNLVLGKLDGQQAHILYQDDQIKDKLQFECGTEDSGEVYSQQQIKHSHDDERDINDCIRLYFEVDFDIYQDKGGMTGTTNYVTGLYNQVATMYANESINTVMSPLVIWSQTSPYSSTSSSGMLNQFTGYRNGFDGDLAMLLSYQASGGIAYVDGLCSNNSDYSMSFSSIDASYNNVPTYSWSVMVVTHEFGHLFGSQHTHACVWNGNGTAIDGCYTTEGSCPSPGIPSGGGTVMSYCHLTSAGINLNLGFGPQPGNLIRSEVSSASCTSACDGGGGPTCTDGIQNGDEEGIDCGGSNCPACPTNCTDNTGTLTILTDNYPGETTWTITSSSGSVLYSGGPYSSTNTNYTTDLCLVDGCFDFNIFDSYGDGICCGYGQGAYTITSGGSTLVSGGQFGSSATDNFCVGGGAGPTCTDGVQNGNETGVDCGGPDCAPCATCNDGVQNGNETGVDCGGPDCAPCPTCNDGVQNGNETDVDCGGPDCAPCTSCNDGILNGDETDVDCGGSCPACPTCEDGIQNGEETDVDCGGQDCAACPTCEDDIQNGNETGIDCGGPDCDACDNGGGGDETVLAHFFETGWDGWQDGGSDCYRYGGSRSYEGNYSIRIRDNSGTASAMTSSAYDVSSYTGLEVNFYFYPNSMENGEDFWLRYYDGSSWSTVAVFARGTSFENNQYYVATVPILSSSYNMANNARFRFQCDASGNADRIYIDAVTVTGLGAGSLVSNEVSIQPVGTPELIQSAGLEEMQIAPNPATEMINITIEAEADYKTNMVVTDLMGRVVKTNSINLTAGLNELPVSIAEMATGTYFVRMSDEEGEPMVKKFIKIE